MSDNIKPFLYRVGIILLSSSILSCTNNRCLEVDYCHKDHLGTITTTYAFRNDTLTGKKASINIIYYVHFNPDSSFMEIPETTYYYQETLPHKIYFRQDTCFIHWDSTSVECPYLIFDDNKSTTIIDFFGSRPPTNWGKYSYTGRDTVMHLSGKRLRCSIFQRELNITQLGDDRISFVCIHRQTMIPLLSYRMSPTNSAKKIIDKPCEVRRTRCPSKRKFKSEKN